MDFIRCLPTVAVVKDYYQILVHTVTNGIIGIRIDGKNFYEDNSGVLSSEKNYAKINVPANELDSACEYTVFFKKTVNRKAYFSEFEPEHTQHFIFKPLKKTDSINIYHIADVHRHFSEAVKTSTYFGTDLDFLILNGDIAEVETEEDYFSVYAFSGEITKGEIPTLIVRGNHDTRGKLAEKYTDYLPSDGKKTYFEFSVGPLGGVVIDCGEDKLDSDEEYGGANEFEHMRRIETEFLKTANPKGRTVFAVAHACPKTLPHKEGGKFDIERQVYADWRSELDRMGIMFMLCGHEHSIYLIEPDNGVQKHGFPIIVGSQTDRKTVEGTALTIKGNKLIVKFTDGEHNVFKETEIEL